MLVPVVIDEAAPPPSPISMPGPPSWISSRRPETWRLEGLLGLDGAEAAGDHDRLVVALHHCVLTLAHPARRYGNSRSGWAGRIRC